jgi:CHASE2 domain-containing sensor protein/serine phosphatase RsbU (regulator of sigma subunit)
MAKASLQKRITIYSAITGGIIALLVVLADATGVLQQLEWWLYDLRAATCQHFAPKPSSQIVHLDIDDDSLERIHRWPWPRSTVASILDELQLAGPKVVAIDVLFGEPQDNRIEQRSDESYVTIPEDPALAKSIEQLGCVGMAYSVLLAGSHRADASLQEAGVAEFARNLKISSAELVSRLRDRGFKQPDLAAQVERALPNMRSQAVREKIRAMLAQDLVSLEQVKQGLAGAVPTTAPAAKVTDSTLDAIVAKEYQHLRSEIALRRFSLASPGDIGAPPAEGSFQATPLPQFCESMAIAGFADYNFFSEPAVRAVPLFVSHQGRLYPQFGLALACRMLDADLSQVSVTPNAVSIPTSSGLIRIPVRQRYSTTVGRDIGCIMDIPWFGEHEWLTMYDWPTHRNIVQHYPIDVAWTIVETRRRLAINNESIDYCINLLLREVLDNKKEADNYASQRLAAEDFAARVALATKVLAQVHEFGMDDPALIGDIKNLPGDVQFKLRAVGALRSSVAENTTLAADLQAKRKELVGIVHDKAVLIGAVATATGDFVTTSLHSRCPGVVVHGVILNAILNRDFLRTAPRWATILLTLMFGLLTTAITSRLPPARAVLLLLLIAALYFAANGLLLFDRWNLIVNAAAPLMAMAACWGGCLVVRLVLETLERIRLKQEAALLDHEITLARQVQAALIPKELNILTKVESHGWTLAATTTGGDCFDLWKLADGRLGILVADASGHGLGPSIIVSEVRALVRALCDLYPEPQQLLERVNARLAADLQGTKFCTCFVGFLTEEGKLSWGSAGHGPMLVTTIPGQPPRELEGTALPLGVSDQWLGDESVPPIQIESGGWLAVVSDGIFEQPDPKGEQFGIERVRLAIDQSRDASCEKVVEAVRSSLHRWQVVPEGVDDQTVVFIRVLEPSAIKGNGEAQVTTSPDGEPASVTNSQVASSSPGTPGEAG